MGNYGAYMEDRKIVKNKIRLSLKILFVGNDEIQHQLAKDKRHRLFQLHGKIRVDMVQKMS